MAEGSNSSQDTSKSEKFIRLYSYAEKPEKTKKWKPQLGIPPHPYVSPEAMQGKQYFAMCEGSTETVATYLKRTKNTRNPESVRSREDYDKAMRQIKSREEHDKAILKQILFAVKHLHDNGHVIPNEHLKPEKITFSENETSIALLKFKPECSNQAAKSENIIHLGNLLYAVLSGSFRPLGNILFVSIKRTSEPELARHLIKSMRERAVSSIENVLEHPFFWGATKKINFIKTFYNIGKSRQSLKDDVNHRGQRVIFNADNLGGSPNEWKMRLKVKPAEDGSFDFNAVFKLSNEFDGSEAFQLFRFIRNIHAHYWEGARLNSQARLLFGNDTEGFWQFFNVRFPHLLIESYLILKEEKKIFEHFQAGFFDTPTDCLKLPPS